MLNWKKVIIYNGLVSAFAISGLASASEALEEHAEAAEMEVVEVVERADFWPVIDEQAYEHVVSELTVELGTIRVAELVGSVANTYEHLVAALEVHETPVRVAALEPSAHRQDNEAPLVPGVNCWKTCF